MLVFFVEIVVEDNIIHLSKVCSILLPVLFKFSFIFAHSHTLTYIETEENNKLNQS